MDDIRPHCVAGSYSAVNAAGKAIMAIATRVVNFEHHDDPNTGSRRFVLTIDLLGVMVAGLLSLLAVRFLRNVRDGHKGHQLMTSGLNVWLVARGAVATTAAPRTASSTGRPGQSGVVSTAHDASLPALLIRQRSS